MTLSFTHKGVDNFDGVYGFDIDLEKEQLEDSDANKGTNYLNGMNFGSEFYSSGAPSSGGSNNSTNVKKEGEKQEVADGTEEMKEFSVDENNLNALVGFLNPGMPKEVFLMYLVSMEYISFQDCNAISNCAFP